MEPVEQPLSTNCFLDKDRPCNNTCRAYNRTTGDCRLLSLATSLKTVADTLPKLVRPTSPPHV